MKKFKTDLHIHSVLSPCADLDMSPGRIIREALTQKLDIIAVTDHNSTRHCELSIELGKKHGLMVLPGCEINTREEIHCLAFFENLNDTQLFQEYLDNSLIKIPNNEDVLGYQLVVDEEENILYREENSLFSSLNRNINEVSEKVRELNGIFVPAHINKPSNSILSQLGFIPHDLQFDALEIRPEFPIKPEDISGYTNRVIYSSDAHFPENIAARCCFLEMNELSFNVIIMALNNKSGRKIHLP